MDEREKTIVLLRLGEVKKEMTREQTRKINDRLKRKRYHSAAVARAHMELMEALINAEIGKVKRC